MPETFVCRSATVLLLYSGTLGLNKDHEIVNSVLELFEPSQKPQGLYLINVFPPNIAPNSFWYREIFIVYQMGRFCGGAHEMSSIPAPLCLCGWVVGGFMG